MKPDFEAVFKKYENLVQEVEQVVEKVGEMYPDKIQCKLGCSECCHALFDLSLVEATYINTKFNEKFEGLERSKLLDKADENERESYRIKRDALRAVRGGKPEAEVLEDLAKMRIACPLLSTEDACEMYEFRPVTCRLYGIPTAVGGKAVSCSKSGFSGGESYPTVHMERIHSKLAELSKEMMSCVRTRTKGLAESLVPMGMALSNVYDAEYFQAIEDDAVIKNHDNPEGIRIADLEEMMRKEQEAAACNCGGSQEGCTTDCSDCSSCGDDSAEAEQTPAAGAVHPSQLGMRKTVEVSEDPCDCAGTSASCTTDCSTCGVEGCGDK